MGKINTEQILNSIEIIKNNMAKYEKFKEIKKIALSGKDIENWRKITENYI